VKGPSLDPDELLTRTFGSCNSTRRRVDSKEVLVRKQDLPATLAGAIVKENVWMRSLLSATERSIVELTHGDIH
jgi:hypothetical protein